MSDAELLAPVPPVDQPPPADPPPESAKESTTPEAEDAELDKMIEEQGIDLPDGTDKLVPLAAVTTAREKLKTARKELADAKAGTAKAGELEAKVATLEQQLNAALPYAQAYQAAVAAQQQPEQPKGPTAEEQAELEEIARDNDYYKTDGTLDIPRAQRMQARITKAAEKIAGAAVAPLHQQTLSDRSAAMLHSAKLTTAPDGSRPAPEILDWVWGRLDPSLTATKEGAQQAFAAAMGYASLLGKTVKAQAAPAKEPLPPPLLTEKSGGKEHSGPSLTEADRRAAKELGLTEKQYAEELGTMPEGWGRRR